MIMTNVPTIIMRPMFPLWSKFNARVFHRIHFFQAQLKGKSSWYSPVGSCLSSLSFPSAACNVKNRSVHDGIYQYFNQKNIGKYLRKNATVKWDHLPLKKNRCKLLIPQSFDTALWKLQLKTRQNHQCDFLIDWCAELPPPADFARSHCP